MEFLILIENFKEYSDNAIKLKKKYVVHFLRNDIKIFWQLKELNKNDIFESFTFALTSNQETISRSLY